MIYMGYLLSADQEEPGNGTVGSFFMSLTEEPRSYR